MNELLLSRMKSLNVTAYHDDQTSCTRIGGTQTIRVMTRITQQASSLLVLRRPLCGRRVVELSWTVKMNDNLHISEFGRIATSSPLSRVSLISRRYQRLFIPKVPPREEPWTCHLSLTTIDPQAYVRCLAYLRHKDQSAIPVFLQTRKGRRARSGGLKIGLVPLPKHTFKCLRLDVDPLSLGHRVHGKSWGYLTC